MSNSKETSFSQYEKKEVTKKQLLFLQKHANYSEEQLGRLDQQTASKIIQVIINKWHKI